MIIQALMTARSDVHFVRPDDTLEKALADLESLGFTTLPVLDGNKFLGVITRRRIFERYFKGSEAERSLFLKTNLVKDHIITEVQIAHSTDLLDEVLYKFLDSRYDFLPVLAEDRFLGIVTRNNMLSAFLKNAGVTKKAHRIAIVVSDFKGALARLTALISNQNADILGIVTFDPEVADLKFVELTVRTDELKGLISTLTANGFSVREARLAG
ncbi:MAG TPA: CBS domain-containing protein [Firmicutes bacterium]|nr:CBS domain-containing protein [Candidatus Fermentithermobacillaceae bacterium]